jgi:hypothetical protein
MVKTILRIFVKWSTPIWLVPHPRAVSAEAQVTPRKPRTPRKARRVQRVRKASRYQSVAAIWTPSPGAGGAGSLLGAERPGTPSRGRRRQSCLGHHEIPHPFGSYRTGEILPPVCAHLRRSGLEFAPGFHALPPRGFSSAGGSPAIASSAARTSSTEAGSMLRIQRSSSAAMKRASTRSLM